MYKLVTKYILVGLRRENDLEGHAHLMMTPIVGAPHDFDTEEQAHDWAVNNHDELRHHREFIVQPVHHLVLGD